MKKLRFLLLESLLIICLITILVFLGINKYNAMFNEFPQYAVKFNDIDGLSVGAPVRFAGLHVGHIVKQELKDHQLYITFKIINRDITIPDGSTVKIEFTGLVGSKSLEIKPPSEKWAGGSKIYPINPLRVNSLMDIFTILSESTLNFSNSIYSVINQNEKKIGNNLKNTTEYLKEKVILLEDSGEQFKNTKKQTIEKAKELKKTVTASGEKIGNVQQTISAFVMEGDIKNNIVKIKNSTENFSEFVKEGKAQEKINEISANVDNLDKKVKELNTGINKIKNKELGYINEFNDSVKSTTQKMQKLIDSSKEKKR